MSDNFPTYRKFVGINVWFKIENDRKFVEIKQIGSKFIRHTVIAEQYPEIILIADMLDCLENRWEKIEQPEFQRVFELTK
jgi:hypothetical protein